jgi:hypothetical protein
MIKFHSDNRQNCQTFHTLQVRYGRLGASNGAGVPYLPHVPHLPLTYIHRRTHTRTRARTYIHNNFGMEGVEGMERPVNTRVLASTPHGVGLEGMANG